MQIRAESLIEGAQRAEGTVVIVDVYRAFTTAAVAFSRGAEKIILVAEVNEALELRHQGVGEMCMGEVGGIRPEGFDLGNSPFEVSQAAVEGKVLIQSTRAGTVGVTSAHRADQVYACSFLVAGATAKAVLRDRPDLVTIVAMGDRGTSRSDEDELCAMYLRNLLEGRTPDANALRTLVLAGGPSQKFDDPAQPQYHPMDREIAVRIDEMPFAIKVSREGGLLVGRRHAV